MILNVSVFDIMCYVCIWVALYMHIKCMCMSIHTNIKTSKPIYAHKGVHMNILKSSHLCLSGCGDTKQKCEYFSPELKSITTKLNSSHNAIFCYSPTDLILKWPEEYILWWGWLYLKNACKNGITTQNVTRE